MQSAQISNDRIKHRYFRYLKDAQGHDEATIDAVAKSLARFEAYTKRRNFKQFHIEQARGFKLYLADQRNTRTDKPLSKSTTYATVTHLKRFFRWLADQPGYRSRIRYADAEYFNPSEKDARVATARRQPRAPTLDQVKRVVELMPSDSVIERRDRALIAFIAITGARANAVASIKLRHVDSSDGCVHQDGRDVHTKFAKTFDTWFFPVWGEARAIVEAWLAYLRTELLFGNDDPVFPATRIELDTNRSFAASGLSKTHWASTEPMRQIFRSAFARAGLQYFNPHSFRHMLAMGGERICHTPEEFKAWSQNLGHEKVMTTFNSYGPVSSWRQAEIMRELEDLSRSGRGETPIVPRLGESPHPLSALCIQQGADTRVFLDTEFADWDDPHTDLISIAMVAEDGREFYVERTDFDLRKCSDFVIRVVLPLLGAPNVLRCDEGALRRAVLAWLADIRDPVIAVDFDGDWDLLVRLLGEDMPANLGITNVYQLLDQRTLEGYYLLHNAPRHHALHDARANRAAFAGELRTNARRSAVNTAATPVRVNPASAQQLRNARS